MRNPADAEDVTQTTFLNAYRAYVEKGSRPEKPQNWLIAIAHNVCRQRFRQSARRPQEVSFEDDIADADRRRRGADAARTSGARSGTSRSTSAPPWSCASSRAALRRDRRDPRALDQRGRDADLPRAARAARAARRVAHLRRGGVRDLAPARRPAVPRRARTAARAPAGMSRSAPVSPDVSAHSAAP